MMVEITEIRIKLMEGSEDRLRAFCSITIDQSFVVRDLKIIDGSNGAFVAMPSRKLTGHCNRCGSKNHLRAGYCNHCGSKVQNTFSNDAPQKLYADIAHPINSECREMIQNAVISEFEAELQRSDQPGYRSRYEDDFDEGDYDESDYRESASAVENLPTSSATTTSESSAARTTDSDRETTTKVSPARDVSRTSGVTSSYGQPSTDLFGAGLFEPPEATNARIDEPQPPRQSPHFAPNRSRETSITETPSQRIDSDEQEATLVRGERATGNRIPRPHFPDARGGSKESVRSSGTGDGPQSPRAVPKTGASDSSDSDASDSDASDSDASDSDGDSSDFGSGIFDG